MVVYFLRHRVYCVTWRACVQRVTVDTTTTPRSLWPCSFLFSSSLRSFSPSYSSDNYSSDSATMNVRIADRFRANLIMFCSFFVHLEITVTTRMWAINVSIPNLKVALLGQFWPWQFDVWTTFLTPLSRISSTSISATVPTKFGEHIG